MVKPFFPSPNPKFLLFYTTKEQTALHAGFAHDHASNPDALAGNLYVRGVEVKIIPKPPGRAGAEITHNRYIHFFEGDVEDTLGQAVGA